MTKPHLHWIAIALAFASTPLLAVPAGGSPALRAATAGELIEAKGTSQRAEIVTFEAGLAPALLRVENEAAVRVTDWPTSPDGRADVVLTRREVYAPGARVIVVDDRGEREVPKSRLAFFSGMAEGDPEVRVFAAVDPETGSVNGFIQTRDDLYELHPLTEVPSLAGPAKGTGLRRHLRHLRHLIAPPEVFRTERGESGEFTCGQNGAPLSFLEERDRIQQMAETDSIFASAISTLHTATIAVDTDNEFMNLKFANNTTTATNYIASLIASMTVIYERDALVRLLQGTTYLRVSTTADPYTQATSGNASVAKLQEFSNIWNTTYAGVTRALAMMLSGKQPGGGASGIAWVNTLCSKYYGTSFSQVYTSGTTPSFGDVLVVAHELGHNFGSPHTHCYATPVDNCYNAEGGCFSGTKSCPASQTINGVTNVTGTLMSYCHLSGLGGCTSSTVFHPRTISEKLGPSIQAAVSTCIFPYVDPTPTVTAVSPASGFTAGGTAISITGANFQNGATVTVGGSAATSVVFVSSTKITAVTPAHAAGKVAVVVTNPNTQTGTLNPGFFYAAPPTATELYTLTPCRVIDTRLANGPLGGPKLPAGQTRTFTVTGTCGIPAGAKAIAVNVTVVNPTVTGEIQIFPGDAFPLGTSTISFMPHPTDPNTARANNSLLTLATDGTGTIGVRNSSAGAVDFLLDVAGYSQ